VVLTVKFVEIIPALRTSSLPPRTDFFGTDITLVHRFVSEFVVGVLYFMSIFISVILIYSLKILFTNECTLY
jgi:hypothetical protein